MANMTDAEFEHLIEFVRRRYETSGQAPDVVQALDDHNVRILGFVDELAEGENLNTADYQLLKTVAILHDAAKAESPLIKHAHDGAKLAGAALGDLGKDEDFVRTVEQAILCHMGPFPFIEEEARKYAERTGEHLHLPRPETWVEKMFYDADMLALMDLQGIEKIVVLRSRTPEFVAEDEETAGAEGVTQRAAAYESALQSVRRGAVSLFSATARSIAARLVAEAEAYIADRLSDERARAGASA